MGNHPSPPLRAETAKSAGVLDLTTTGSSLAEADTGFPKSNLQGPDQLDFGTSIERAIE
jgi:hypothetical protein